ncbi:MAG: serine protease [Chloroflexi bacterium]|nr:serine protease [Chloroflexota bacterium]
MAGTFADGTAFRADFLANYTQTGGIERWGYPTSAIVEERPGTLTQYYQRGVVDWQPPPAGGAPTFQRRLAWDYLGGGLGGSIDQGVELHLTNPNPGELLGPWGHKVSNQSVEGEDIGFADFFHRLGGVASFGFPKTDARADDHPEADLHIPGRPPDSRIRQYFQAAVLEYHPESAASPVKLRLLGDTLRDSRYPRRAWQQYLAFGPEAPLAVGDQLDLGLESRRGPHGDTAEDVAKFLELALLRVRTDQACGTGFFVTESGYALIPWRLAVDAATMSVASPRGYTANAQIVAGHQGHDLALIKVDGDGHIPVQLGESAGLAHGTELVATGFDATKPETGRGVECQAEPTATSIWALTVQAGQQLTFTPTINAGKSGSPVATTTGRVVGIAGSTSPERSQADSALTAEAAQALVDAWLDDIASGAAASRPARPLFDRITLIEREGAACPRDIVASGRAGGAMAFWVEGGPIELTATIWKNPAALSGFLIELGNTSARPYEPHDVISFTEYTSLRTGIYANLRWTRYGFGYDAEWQSIRREVHPILEREDRFHVRFVYDRGSVALYINGEVVHLEAGLPYDDDVSLSLGCTGSSEVQNIYFYDIRVTGQLIPST